jgi:HK97 family phage prohead protease
MPEIIRKVFGSAIEKDADNGYVVTISTKDVDRDGDIMEPKGCQLENYQKNPVVLWGHDHSVPAIGRAGWVKRSDEAVKAKIYFASTPFAQDVKTLYDEGILNSFSVGFMRIADEPIPKNDRGRRITKWELVEFSAVNVPSNPNALMQRCAEMAVETKTLLGVKEVVNFDKFPHHTEGKAVEPTLLRIAMGSLLLDRQIKAEERAEQYSHLEAHYKDLGLDLPDPKNNSEIFLVQEHFDGKILLPYSWLEKLGGPKPLETSGQDVSAKAYDEALRKLDQVVEPGQIRKAFANLK